MAESEEELRRKRSEAAAILGHISTPKKRHASRLNGELGGRPQRAILELACICGAGDVVEGHTMLCPRGRAAIRRRLDTTPRKRGRPPKPRPDAEGE